MHVVVTASLICGRPAYDMRIFWYRPGRPSCCVSTVSRMFCLCYVVCLEWSLSFLQRRIPKTKNCSLSEWCFIQI